MKKFLLSAFVCVFTTSVALAQAPASGPINQVGPDGKRTGFWRISAALLHLGPPWLPGQTVEEGNFANGLKTGLWVEYYQNGNKKGEYTYVNNRPNGPAKKYFENGNLMEEGNWVGTRWTGPYKLYYEDGTIRQSWNYNALGQRDGRQLYYHPNGQIAIDMTSKAGKEEGWAKEYNTNGELIKETFHTNGVIDNSKTKVYEPKKAEDPNAGKAPEELEKKEDAPIVKPGSGNTGNAGEQPFDGNGPHTLYNTNKQVTFVGEFKNWKLMKGEQRLYDANGKCIRVKLYADGKYVGDGPLPKEEDTKK